jgi:hypothetical protein
VSKGDDRRTNIGEYVGADCEDGASHAERMAKFDRLPKKVRRFLAEQAPFDYAVGPFAAHEVPSDVSYLTTAATMMMRNEVLAAYGPEHPQARNPGALALTPRTAKRRRRGERP